MRFLVNRRGFLVVIISFYLFLWLFLLLLLFLFKLLRWRDLVALIDGIALFGNYAERGLEIRVTRVKTPEGGVFPRILVLGDSSSTHYFWLSSLSLNIFHLALIFILLLVPEHGPFEPTSLFGLLLFGSRLEHVLL